MNIIKKQHLNHTLKYIVISFIVLVLFVVILPDSGHPWDNYCWADWSDFIRLYGLKQMYCSTTDYLPLYHYILKVYSLTQNSTEEIYINIRYLKISSLVFHFITGYFIYRLVKRNNGNWDTALINTFFYLFNAAVLYNALIWGQVDIILTCFVFISVYCAMRHQSLLSIIFLLLALNFKLHAIIFVPVIGLMLLPRMILYFSFKKFLGGLILLAALQYLILLPFILGRSIENLPAVIVDSVGKYPVVSAYAFNMWHLFLSGNLSNLSDAELVAGVAYKIWGLLLFFMTSALALFPLLKQLYFSFKTKAIKELSTNKILLICALIPLLFFYFNTQMHERYSHPALAFLITYSIVKRRPALSIIASAAYFLNLEAELKFLQLHNYETVIFHTQFISGLYLLTIIGVFLHLYELDAPEILKKLGLRTRSNTAKTSTPSE